MNDNSINKNDNNEFDGLKEQSKKNGETRRNLLCCCLAIESWCGNLAFQKYSMVLFEMTHVNPLHSPCMYNPSLIFFNTWSF